MVWVTTTVGAALILLTLADLLATAVSVGHGAGPLTGRIAQGVWRMLLSIRKWVGSDRVLVAGGPLILLAVISVWVLLLIIGWSIVFGRPETLLAVQDGQPVPVFGRVRYAASIVIGRGSSAVQPSGSVYEILEPIAAVSGLTALSLSIAYVLPVVQGVVAKRSLALYMSTLGHSPQDVLIRAWNGERLGQLDLHLIALTPRVAQVAQSHLAYPIIHYFHSTNRATALGPSIVTIDQALTAHELLDDSVAIDTMATEPLREAIDDFLDTLRYAFVEPADVEVAPGDERMTETRERLAEAGLPLDAENRTELSEEDVARNRLLRGYLADDGWEDADALGLHRSDT